MPIKGVTLKEEEIILSILKPYLERYDFYFYGSRVKGSFRPLSDLDILVVSQNEIDMFDIEDIKQAFDESLLSYVVNLSFNIDDKFYNIIKSDLVKIRQINE